VAEIKAIKLISVQGTVWPSSLEIMHKNYLKKIWKLKKTICLSPSLRRRLWNMQIKLQSFSLGRGIVSVCLTYREVDFQILTFFQHGVCGCVCVCVYIYVCVCVYVYVCVYIYICVCVYMYMCVCIYMCVCVYVYVCVYICVCVYIYIYMCVCVCFPLLHRQCTEITS